MKHFTLLFLSLLFSVFPLKITAQEVTTEPVHYTSTFMNFALGVAGDAYAAGLLNTVEANDWSWEAMGESYMPTFQMTTFSNQQCLQAIVREPSLNLTAEFKVPGKIQTVTINMGGNIGKLELDFGGSEQFTYVFDVSDRDITAYSFPFNGLDVESTLPNQSVKIRLYKKDAESTDPMYLQVVDIETEVTITDGNNIVSNFYGVSTDSQMLFSTDGNRNWYYALPEDGTTLTEAYNTRFNDEDCVYLGLSGGSSTYHRLTLTPDFDVFGTVKKIIVKAAGDIALLSYTSPYGETWNSEMTTQYNPYFKDFELDFEDGLIFQNDLSFYLYAGRRTYLQSITLVMEGPEIGDETTITSTFTMLMETDPLDENWQHGIVGTEEGFIWDLFVQGQSTLMSATNLSFDGETMIPCLLVGNPASSEETVFHIKNQFSLKGPVSKVVIRATGQIENIEAILCEKQTGDNQQQVQTALGNYKDGFIDYELRFDGTMEYQDGTLDIYFSGSGGIFVNSITIFQGEGGEESEFSGMCGPDLKWNLTKLSYSVWVWDYETNQQEEKPAYRLAITGSGLMNDYVWGEDYASTAPWMKVGSGSITEIEMSEGITHIGDEAFDECYNAHVMNIPNSLTSIGSYAFCNVSSWSSPDLYLPANLIALGSHAFAYCSGIKNIYIPARLTNIEYAALSGISSLENFYVDKDNSFYKAEGNAVIERLTNKLVFGNKNTLIPFGVEAIGDYAFYNVDAQAIAIPGSVKSIGGDAFSFSNITSVEIPSSVTFIDTYAFYGCSKLLTVDIGRGVTQICSNVFYNCTNIADVNCYADPNALTWMESSNEGRLFKPDKMTKMHVRAADLEKWQEKFSFLNVTFVPDLSASIIPITEEMEVRASFFDGVNLYDTSLGNVYYNLNPSTGNGYTDGYIFITQTTDMSQINDAIPGSSDIRDKFTGIILEVGPGEGVIALDVATKGNISLVVQIGDGTPTYAVRNERGEVFVSYNVSEPTYVYFYAVGSSASLVRALGNAEEDLYDNVLLIYGFSVYPGADETGIKSLTPNPTPVDEGSIYDLSGRRVEGLPAKKGIYIVNGKKVSFK
jgi:hypothetical protein